MPPKQRKSGKLRTLRRPSVSGTKAARVKGGAEPITGGPSKATPISDRRLK